MSLARLAPNRLDVPYVEWDAFRRQFVWRQGEHVSLVGPTQTGKTTLGIAILDLRSYVVALGTKPADPVLSRLLSRRAPVRFRRDDELPELRPGERTKRVVVWPPAHLGTDAELARQKVVLGRVLRQAYAAGGWTVFADEASYLSEMLRLDLPMKRLWKQSASNNVSFVAATQRPAWVPRDIYSSATHLFLWRTNDDEDLRRLSGMNGVSSRAVRELVASLEHHEALYVNTRTKQMLRTRAPRS